MRVVPSPGPIRRPRARRYGKEVQEALSIAWAATNYIGSKRLAPFLEELVPALEEHGHLKLSEEDRYQLCRISHATIDRILRSLYAGDAPRGISTTKRGTLLNHQVPVRTFADWNEMQPGFLEADLVAHCGQCRGRVSAYPGAYRYRYRLGGMLAFTVPQPTCGYPGS